MSFGGDRRTVAKIPEHSLPPGYRRSEPAKRPKLDPFTDIIDRILEQDLTRPKKQRLGRNAIDRRRGSNTKTPSLLAGLLIDEDGDRLRCAS